MKRSKMEKVLEAALKWGDESDVDRLLREIDATGVEWEPEEAPTTEDCPLALAIQTSHSGGAQIRVDVSPDIMRTLTLEEAREVRRRYNEFPEMERKLASTANMLDAATAEIGRLGESRAALEKDKVSLLSHIATYRATIANARDLLDS